jgi:hypothetical protein
MSDPPEQVELPILSPAGKEIRPADLTEGKRLRDQPPPNGRKRRLLKDGTEALSISEKKKKKVLSECN